MNTIPLVIPREAHLLHCLVEDYVRYKHQNYPATAHQVLGLIKQTVDDVIEHPERFAIDVVDEPVIMDKNSGSTLRAEVIPTTVVRPQAECSVEPGRASTSKTGFPGIDEAIDTIDRVTDVAKGKRRLG